MGKCVICGCSSSRVIYDGPIRMGMFGALSSEAHRIVRCSKCLAGSLANAFGSSEEYYQSETYRKEVDGGAKADDYFRLHDAEQIRHLSITGTGIFRGKVVADIGCGGGSFLDGIRGYAADALAIEPSATFRASLKSRGYKAYAFVDDALTEYKGRIDLVTAFDVLEHVEDPRSFLAGIQQLLVTGGKVVLSTPNSDDLLIEALPSEYSAFFYRKAHLWYFDREALLSLLRLAGFTDMRVIPHQRFGLGNFLGWLRDKRPQGEISPSYISPILDATWKAELERSFRCDCLYVEATA